MTRDRNAIMAGSDLIRLPQGNASRIREYGRRNERPRNVKLGKFVTGLVFADTRRRYGSFPAEPARMARGTVGYPMRVCL
jgi:hypothetical protein